MPACGRRAFFLPSARKPQHSFMPRRKLVRDPCDCLDCRESFHTDSAVGSAVSRQQPPPKCLIIVALPSSSSSLKATAQPSKPSSWPHIDAATKSGCSGLLALRTGKKLIPQLLRDSKAPSQEGTFRLAAQPVPHSSCSCAEGLQSCSFPELALRNLCCSFKVGKLERFLLLRDSHSSSSPCGHCHRCCNTQRQKAISRETQQRLLGNMIRGTMKEHHTAHRKYVQQPRMPSNFISRALDSEFASNSDTLRAWASQNGFQASHSVNNMLSKADSATCASFIADRLGKNTLVHYTWLHLSCSDRRLIVCL